MNDNHGNGADLGFNGTPYHSADNGFACAAANRGVTNTLQNHLDIIIRNEELTSGISHSQTKEKIEWLNVDKERLEQQKLDRLDDIKTLKENLSEKDTELVKLQVELEVPMAADPPSPDPRLDALKDKIDERTTVLEEKQVTFAGLETDLEAPTESELKPPNLNKTSVSRFSIPEYIFAGFATIALFGLVFYLFIFYSAAGDKAFTAGSGTVEQRLNEFINPFALFNAWESKNLFILAFPIIFLMLAILIHFCLENGGWWWFGVLGLGLSTLLLDGVIAYKISQNIYESKVARGLESGEYLWQDNWLEILSVLLLGFAVSVFLSFGIHFVLKMWKKANPPEDEVQAQYLDKIKRTEQNERMVQKAILATEIEHLKGKVGKLVQEKMDYENSIETSSKQELEILTHNHKQPIQAEIARLTTERESLLSQIKEQNEKVESFQKEINRCETEIADLLDSFDKQIVDVKKLEAQVNEFVSGWCRYVTQSKAELPSDVREHIQDIQDLKDDTVKKYTDNRT